MKNDVLHSSGVMTSAPNQPSRPGKVVHMWKKVATVLGVAALGVAAMVAASFDSNTTKAGLGSSLLPVSTLYGEVTSNESLSNVTGSFALIDRSTGLTVWETTTGQVFATRTPGKLTYVSYTNSEQVTGYGSYEWSFRVNASRASTSTVFNRFYQNANLTTYEGTVQTFNLAGRIADTRLIGAPTIE